MAKIRARFAELSNAQRAARYSSAKKDPAAAKLPSIETAYTAPRVDEQSTRARDMAKKAPVKCCTPAQAAVKVNNASAPQRNHPEEITLHHIPPRKAKVYDRKRVTRKVHEAYHAIFGPSPTFEACVEILRRDWWPESTGDSNFEGQSVER
jgi:hypothetical protein